MSDSKTSTEPPSEVIRVLFDHQMFEGQKFGGASRYFTELYQNFLNRPIVRPKISIRYCSNVYLQQIHPPVPIRPSEFKFFKRFRFLQCRAVNHLTTLWNVKRNQHDIYHPTSYSDRYLVWNKKPVVLTVYDMTDEIYTDQLNSKYVSDQKRKICSQADAIIAISHSTKNDLVELFGVDPGKIHVIHLAGGFAVPTKQKSRKEIGLPENYILYVGGRQFYKNFSRFVEASALLIAKNKDVQVICTGRAFNSEELELLNRYHLTGHFSTRFCQEDDFYYLYHFAQFFVFPSMYEGFGIPVLESFSAQCPCLASNSSSLSEVGGDAALYFEPLDTRDLSEKMLALISDETLRKSLVEKGTQRLTHFSWKKTADETLAVYKNLA